MADYSIIGKRFGKLTVTGLSHVINGHMTYWTCICDCGKQTVVLRGNLTNGQVRSCGCLRGHRVRDDITGQRFGRLTVIGFDHDEPHSQSYWSCRCDCGNEIVVYKGNLISGRTISCGCYRKEVNTTHGLRNSRIYSIWEDMKDRCNNKNSYNYSTYGGRGIDICDEWNAFEPFYKWSMDNGYNDNLTIDRIDNNRGYYPDNCRWVDWYIQANNTSRNHRVTYNGVTHTIAEWTRMLGISYSALWKRIKYNNMSIFEDYFAQQEATSDEL